MLRATIKDSPSSSLCFAGINNLFLGSRVCLNSPDSIFSCLLSMSFVIFCELFSVIFTFLYHFAPLSTTVTILYDKTPQQSIANLIFLKKLFSKYYFFKKFFDFSDIYVAHHSFFLVILHLFTFLLFSYTAFSYLRECFIVILIKTLSTISENIVKRYRLTKSKKTPRRISTRCVFIYFCALKYPFGCIQVGHTAGGSFPSTTYPQFRHIHFVVVAELNISPFFILFWWQRYLASCIFSIDATLSNSCASGSNPSSLASAAN